MKDVREFLSGKKTYLVGIGIIAYAEGVARGWWPNDVQVWGVLGASGMMTVRAAITKLLLQIAAAADLPIDSPPAEAVPGKISPPVLQQPKSN